MPIISFPSAPSLNDTYSFNGKTWIYNGEGWMLSAAGSINGIPIGNVTPATGNFTTVGATGNITTDQYFIGNGSQLTGITASGMLTVSNIAPISPNAGDVWIAANTGAQYVYFTSGGNSQWAEMEADTSISITTSSGANIDLTAVASNIIPAANITYDIGNTSNRFRDIYLANSTIYLGDAEISANGSNVVLASAVITSAVIASATVGNMNNDSTGYMSLPVGNTAQRPVAATAGMMRYNTTTGYPEWYDGSAWYQFNLGKPYEVEYLLVGGGGGGGSDLAGGGGAGGYIYGSTTVMPTTDYSVVIGAGGTAGSGRPSTGSSNGANTTVFLLTAVGGGTTAGYRPAQSSSGSPGGSGGGGSGVDSTSYSGAAGSGTPGQGNPGGLGGYIPYYGGGGGGGAGAAGTSAYGTVNGGAGGAGLNWQSLGTFYAGGGGGGGYGGGGATTQASGGSGGGGTGGIGSNQLATAGTTNTGGGGGGGGYGNNGPTGTATAGGAGGSGIVIIRYLGTPRATGGTVTTVGSYTYHTFTNSGTYTA